MAFGGIESGIFEMSAHCRLASKPFRAAYGMVNLPPKISGLSPNSLSPIPRPISRVPNVAWNLWLCITCREVR
jgi:hypothetical protein